jgi:hypothetical protein
MVGLLSWLPHGNRWAEAAATASRQFLLGAPIRDNGTNIASVTREGG